MDVIKLIDDELERVSEFLNEVNDKHENAVSQSDIDSAKDDDSYYSGQLDILEDLRMKLTSLS